MLDPRVKNGDLMDYEGARGTFDIAAWRGTSCSRGGNESGTDADASAAFPRRRYAKVTQWYGERRLLPAGSGSPPNGSTSPDRDAAQGGGAGR